MKRTLQHIFSFSISKTHCILLCALICQLTAAAQCPQRYRERVFDKVNARLNIKYGIEKMNTDGTKTWQAFDLYEPKDDTAQLRPLIILIHGGGFTNWPPLVRTSPEIVEMCRDMAKRGYVAISPEYRLFSGDATYKKMAETIVAASFDIHDFMCFISNSIADGNPYRIDTSRIFMGGSSAGALIALNFGLFINDTADLNADLRQSMNIVAAFDGIDPQAVFRNKFCGLQPKGIIGISAAIIDTNFIQPRSGNVLLVHGKLDGAIPYMSGYPLGNPALPKIYGPGVYLDRLQRSGVYVEADIYPDKYHVPVIYPFGDNISLALQLVLQTGTIFDVPILDSTERHMAQFCYNIIGKPVTNCLTTGIRQPVVTGQLSIFPNPSTGLYTIIIPQTLKNKKTEVTVYDSSGKIILQEASENNESLNIDISGAAKGVYWLSIRTKDREEETVYIDKIIRS